MKSFQFFKKAFAVWPVGLAGEKNVRVSFHASVSVDRTQSVVLRITGASVFRVWINGRFLASGPARAAHGFARVDEYQVPDRFFSGKTMAVVLELSDYGVATFFEARGDAFCCTEILVDGRVERWTGDGSGGFAVERREEVVQRVERYSYQRGFCEAYRLGVDERWREAGYTPSQPLPLAEVTPPREWIARGVAYPAHEILQPRRHVEFGAATFQRRRSESAREHRFLHRVPEVCEGFLLSEREWPLYETVAGLRFTGGGKPEPILHAKKWMRVDFGKVETGFPQFRITTTKETRLVAIYDEILIDGQIQFDRLESLNAIRLDLPAGADIDFLAFEPCTLRYLQIVVLQGAAAVTKIALRNYSSSVKLRPPAHRMPPAFQEVRRAALASFRQNAVDIFMDCPSRERAGWLCDSFFTARAEWHLSGDNAVERAFLENYLRPKNFDDLPKGMVPMCYPAEALEGVFIPNWAMFLVLQLAEARRRRRLPAAWRPLVDRRVRGLLSYFRKFENEFGLLEKLESWVFVEWSGAQSFVQDINFPTNMLYAAMLEEAAYLLGEKSHAQKARRIRASIRVLAWKDGRYADHAKRKGRGPIKVQPAASEVCQYYAFSFGLESFASKPELWSRLVREDYGDLCPANAFIGKLLRLELLVQAGEHEAARREIRQTYQPMARRTGTLWEHVDTRASCNHGFTAYLAVLIDRMASPVPTDKGVA